MQSFFLLTVVGFFKGKQKLFVIIHDLSMPSHEPHHCVSQLTMCLTVMLKEEKRDLFGRAERGTQLLYRL